MRVTSYPIATLRDTPAEAEIISHQLLLRGGYIRRISSGIYAYMPIMLKIIEKISSVIEKELNSIGCNKLLLPMLHPAELWERSGRWEGYTAGEGIMFNLIDRQNRSFGLAPTHEEVITAIASEIVNSYKQLPVCYYQIQTKFRDEIRPRFGLMRSREFIMKDAYSFHSSESDLKNFYNKIEQGYENIFRNCGIETVGVDADSGAIGGSASKEFMVTAESGEDSILYTESGSYAANIEKAISIPSKEKPLEIENKNLLFTPGQTSVSEICKENKFDLTQIVKVILFLGIFDDNSETPILVCLRGDQTVNEVKLFNLINAKHQANLINLKVIEKTKDINKNLIDLPFGFVGPDIEDSTINSNSKWQKKWVRVVDHSAYSLKLFVTGANKLNYHKITSFNSLDNKFIEADVRNSKAGDYITNEMKEILIEKRGIEIGHIFQLGQKYSQKLNAQFSNHNGKLENIWMGCYGIGVTRLAQASIEQNHDNDGICWPIQIAPFEVILIPANIKDSYQRDLAEEIYLEFKKSNIDILFDDRDERAGMKFKDADLIGIPFRIVVGRDAVNNQVELICRKNKAKINVDRENILEKFLYESKLMYN